MKGTHNNGNLKGYRTFFDELSLLMTGFDPSDGAGFRLKPDLRLRYLRVYFTIFGLWPVSFLL